MSSKEPAGQDSATVVNLERQMLEQKNELEQQLEQGTITAEEFAIRVNQLLTSTLGQAAAKLSPEEFQSRFGFSYKGQVAVLIDPKAAAASADQE